MAKSAERASNIELLCIVAMFLIILHHMFVHCATAQLTSADSIARMGNGLFCQPIQYERLFIFSAAASWGKIGNAIFILVSGYFLVGRGSHIDLARSAVKLLSQAIFAPVVLMGVSGIVKSIVGRSYSFVKCRCALI